MGSHERPVVLKSCLYQHPFGTLGIRLHIINIQKQTFIMGGRVKFVYSTLLIITPFILFAKPDFDEGETKPRGDRFRAKKGSSYYCHFNIPFYMSSLNGEKKSKVYFYPRFASQIGQFQYTRKINDTTKWGWR